MHRFNILSLSKFWSLGFWTLILFVIWNLLFGIFGFKEAHAGLIVQRPLYIGLTSGLVGYWSFDGQDMADVTAFDRSGNNNRGTLTNGPVRAVGKIGQALNFDGVNDRVAIPDSSSLAFTGDVTLSAWIRPSTLAGGDHTVITKGSDSPSDGWGAMIYHTAGTPKFAVVIAGTQYTVTGAVLSANSWYHLVGVRSGSTLYLYVNSLQTSAAAVNGSLRHANESEIGDLQPYSNEFNGLIDEVRIYNRALGPDEIRRLYNIGATLKLNKPRYTDSLANGLVGSWSFDGQDMSGNVAYDRSGNSNTGTLTNGPRREAGRVGQALSFDGSNDYVNAGSNTSLDNITVKTITAWIYPISSGEANNGRIVDKDQTTFFGWFFFVCSDSGCEYSRRLRFLQYFNNGTSNGAWNSAAGSISLNRWQHVAVIYDRSSTANDPTFYINGVVSTATETNTPSGSADNDANNVLTIGNRQDIDRTFNGLIDEVRIYNRALTSDEVKRLYNMGR